jgi:hypothetical protein
MVSLVVKSFWLIAAGPHKGRVHFIMTLHPMACVFGLFVVPPVEYCGSRHLPQALKAAGGKLHGGEPGVLGLGACCLGTDPAGGMMGLWKAAMGK